VIVLAFAASSLAARPPRRCAQLKGPSLVRSASVKVARIARPTVRPHGSGVGLSDYSALYGCIRPDGPVHLLGTQSTQFLGGIRHQAVVSSTGIDVGASAGALITVISRFSDNLDDLIRKAWVYDLASGRTLYTFVDVSEEMGIASPSARQLPTTLRLAPNGCLVGLFPFFDPSGTVTTVERLIAFEPSGQAQRLDSAPAGAIAPTSLALSGDAVTWTDAGTARAAMACQAPRAG